MVKIIFKLEEFDVPFGICISFAEYNSETKTIYINWKLAKQYYKRVFLHELFHHVLNIIFRYPSKQYEFFTRAYEWIAYTLEWW